MVKLWLNKVLLQDVPVVHMITTEMPLFTTVTVENRYPEFKIIPLKSPEVNIGKIFFGIIFIEEIKGNVS